MQKTITQKVVEGHLAQGQWKADGDIAIRVDQVILQDATGTQACMQFEQLAASRTLPDLKPTTARSGPIKIEETLQDGMTPLLQFEQFGEDSVRVPLAVQYVDHNIKQIDERNADDHAFLLTMCQRYGLNYSPMGNGICHQVHVERFAAPGATILGADSHTTTSGAVGALALGVGGLDVASVLAGNPFWLRTPKVVNVILDGKLQPWVSAKDIILELLRRYSVKWGIDVAGIGGTMVLEFTGPGVATLGVPQRATIANMAAEVSGTALFPSDERTREFLHTQRRQDMFREMSPDPGAVYDLVVRMDLAELEPLIAKPSSPDNVVKVSDVEGTPVAQVCVGSSVNSWYEDAALVAYILRGKRLPMVHTPEGERLLQLLISPGSHQILNVMERKGFLKDLRQAGGVILESACGPCVGMGGAPPSGANSVRTMNRNFPGRSGTKGDRVWLSSSETAAATALHGVITDPRKLGAYPDIGTYELVDRDFTDHLFVRPLKTAEERRAVKVIRGPHIKPPPRKSALPASLAGEIIAVFGDNISTGSISPDGVIVMGKRSNVGDIAKHTFEKEMPSAQGGASEFYMRAKDAQKRHGSFVVAGQNYGQGSSREAAAMVMVELLVHAVLARSFARIHRTNLISQGILPLVIPQELHDTIAQGSSLQKLELPDVLRELSAKSPTISVLYGGKSYVAEHFFNDRERELVRAGGLINALTVKRP